MKKDYGFTLVEVVIVLVVIAILAGVALPSYRDHMSRGRRADAHASITKIQLAQENWRASNTTYTATLSNLGFSSSASADGYYTLSISNATATGYQVAAAPAGAQAGDSCGTLTVTFSNGSITNYSPSKTSTTGAKCWR